jgi:signal transduction histidine kinase
MGGGVSVTSREGEGTRFRVTLGAANSHVLSLGEAA